MANEVVEYKQQSVEDRFEFAKRLAAAGDMLPRGLKGQIRQADGTMVQAIVPGKVFLITETARMLGVDPMAGLQGINVIEGAASIAPSLMQALVRRAGHKIRVKTTGTIEGGDLKATATLTRNDDPEPFVVEWTIWDAIRAGLVDEYFQDSNTRRWVVRARSEQKDLPKPWETYTRQMLKWRAQAEVIRDGAEEVLLGVHYTPEELGAVVREDGGTEQETLAEYESVQAQIIDRIRAAGDKAALTAIFDELNADDHFAGKVEAEFYSRMGVLNIEDADVVDDAPKESGPAEAAQGHQDDETAAAAENPSEPPKAADGRTAPRRSGDGAKGPLGPVAPAGPQGPIGPVHPSILESEDWEAQQIAEHEARVASGEVEE